MTVSALRAAGGIEVRVPIGCGPITLERWPRSGMVASGERPVLPAGAGLHRLSFESCDVSPGGEFGRQILEFEDAPRPVALPGPTVL